MKKFFRVLGGLAALSFLAAVMSCGGGASPNSPSNDAIAVETAKSLVTIQYAKDDQINDVKQSVTLSSGGISGVSVTWTSSNPEIIKIEGSTGKVTRPKKDTDVTLTATLKKGNETATKSFELLVSGTVSDQLWPILSHAKPEKDVIFGSDTSLTLSDTVTWTSNHPEIIAISNSGIVTVTPPVTKTAVVLTATATEDGVSESREFTVTVYPAGSTPTAQDLLSSIPFTAKKINYSRRLPSTINGVPGTQITWISDKPQSVSIEGGPGEIRGFAHHSLRNVTVTLTATLTYNGSTASKTFDVTVERITEATHLSGSGTYTFTDTVITFIQTSASPDGETHTMGNRWAYTLGQEEWRITAHKTHSLSEDGRWIAIGSAEYKQLQKDYMEKYLKQRIDEVTVLKALSEKPNVTLIDCGQALGFASSLTEKEVYKKLQQMHFIPQDQNYDTFATLSDQQKTAAIHQVINTYKQNYIGHLNLPLNADWARILTAVTEYVQKMREKFETEYQAMVAKETASYVYTYRCEHVSDAYHFSTTAVYDSTKKWFEQHGSYSRNPTSTPYHYITLSLAYFPEVSFSYNGQYYNATLNSDGTAFEAKDSIGQTVKGTITDNKNGTLSLTIEGISETYTLEFNGSSLN